ncbi:MAG: pirin family protein [Cytophagaceae bacterium]|jgi:hypothetical protein|nr:pirin family protein [Cytophagaceae bacterium]
MKTVFHAADSRGYADHGWLKSYHSFSFAGYYHPDRIQFGALRVLNDDWVQGGAGFGMHPHKNMEIISIPLSGGIRHKDSTGHQEVLQSGEVQVMSAGKGIYHSEHNASSVDPAKFLQVWILPHTQELEPSYQQKKFEEAAHNHWQLLVSPDGEQQSLKINQHAWISRLNLSKNEEVRYTLHAAGQGLYIFAVSGALNVHSIPLKTRDALGISQVESITIHALDDSQLIVFEVPM